MPIGPTKVYTYSCVNCDYRDDVICTKLFNGQYRILNALDYTTPMDCPYISKLYTGDSR